MWYHSIDQVIQTFKTDKHKGLSEHEVAKRRLDYGDNALPEGKRISIIKLFVQQFASVFIAVLLGVLIISAVLGEWVDALVIAAIVFINACIGFYQEYQAEKSLAALKKLTKPMSRVLRDGVVRVVLSAELVPGDIVLLEAGDIVPADGRLFSCAQLACQEASLTGESTPVAKIIDVINDQTAAVGDRKNMVFMGTVVVRGKGTYIVTATGQQTELGKIALLLDAPEEQTPLQKQLARVGIQLVYVSFVIVSVMFVLGVLRGQGYVSMLLTSLSLAVAAIPEGLPAVITIALSVGVYRMAKRKAIVRRLLSVETLGSTSVICTDKTGTLTRNEMVTQKLWADNHEYSVSGVGYAPTGEISGAHGSIVLDQETVLQKLLTIGVLCNDAHILKENGSWRLIGDPTEGAFLAAASKVGLHKEVLVKQYDFVDELPFDSERKRMSVVRMMDGKKTLLLKGAADVVVHLATHILTSRGVVVLEQHDRDAIKKAHDDFARQALRVLAVAYKELDHDSVVDHALEQNVIFVGLVAMMDPPRPEVKDAIAECARAGIKTVMITGDHKETARAIGVQLGLFDGDDARIMTGRDLDLLSEDDLQACVEDIVIYARTSAEHKMRIVKAFKERGHTVAVTGDGVNDAPAIKAADVGAAMGITGTEVTKEAADMVITDDNFASIVNAVREGRGIYDNIMKFINFLLSANIAELSVIFIAIVLGLKDPQGNPFNALLPIQLLWLNLVTDGLPAIALAMDPIDPEAMHKPVRLAHETMLSQRFALEIVMLGILLTIGIMAAALIGVRTSAVMGYTMTLTSFVVLEIVRIHMVRSRYHIGFFSNAFLIGAISVSLGLQLCIMYIPALQGIFRMTALGFVEWGIIIGIAIGVLLLGKILENVSYRVKKS
ncbi:MAG: hypothetical protein US69_C0003G0016 [candidate division TM6 bacterium GW2011_GWF2_38_10]|nr:MAG: hypothetical protein US69_C0003G0016 [candidate division TM6 bacterium GW2011_GWF2_38_10]